VLCHFDSIVMVRIGSYMVISITSHFLGLSFVFTVTIHFPLLSSANMERIVRRKKY